MRQQQNAIGTTYLVTMKLDMERLTYDDAMRNLHVLQHLSQYLQPSTCARCPDEPHHTRGVAKNVQHKLGLGAISFESLLMCHAPTLDSLSSQATCHKSYGAFNGALHCSHRSSVSCLRGNGVHDMGTPVKRQHKYRHQPVLSVLPLS